MTEGTVLALGVMIAILVLAWLLAEITKRLVGRGLNTLNLMVAWMVVTYIIVSLYRTYA